MTRHRFERWMCFTCVLLCCAFLARSGNAVQLNSSSKIDSEFNKIRYGLLTESGGDLTMLAFNEGYTYNEDGQSEYKRKSPEKAFLLSLVIPGAGQFYNGSIIKPIVFLGVEAAAWGLYANYHSKGEDMTDEFEAFNDAHWVPDHYADYMRWTYEAVEGDDKQIPPSVPSTEITHHLPDTKTQQYYEMTGKYDQFAWGWDDATLEGNDLYYYDESNPPPRFIDRTPTSSNRDLYETMRDDANKEFDKATKMLMLSVANHLVSAFEAYLGARSHNKAIDDLEAAEDSGFLSQLKLKPSLKSYHSDRDTPFLKVTYKF